MTVKSTSLLFLYSTVLVPIYSEWIGMDDLCFLDTALCNQHFRNRFLNLVPLCRCTELVNEGDIFLDWVILRGLRINKLNAKYWTPVIDALIQSKRVSSVFVGLEELALRLNEIKTNARGILLDLSPYSFDSSKLKIVGSAVTGLTFENLSDEIVSSIAECCPNLKTITASFGLLIAPIVDACQLDEINNCHLGSLVKREKCEWTYSCDLKRTYEVDETAVCLGEGKYYRLANLRNWSALTEEDTKLLIPMMPHLTHLTIEKSGSRIISAAVEKCRKLTELHALDTDHHPCELKSLLQQASLLRLLNIEVFRRCIVDECIEVLAKCCPLLEVCSLSLCCVTSEHAAMELFRKCHFLTEFSAYDWPCQTDLLDSCESLELTDRSSLHKWGRGLTRLVIPHRVGKDVLCALFSKSPGLRTISLKTWSGELTYVIEALVLYCPLVSKFRVNRIDEKSSSLVALGRLHHLISLSVSLFEGFTVDSLSSMLENKSSSLLSLCLSHCGITNDMVAAIGRLCPALTNLNLSFNPIEDAALINLLSSCTLLEELSIYDCSHITSKILPHVKPPMKKVLAYHTSISSR